MTTTKKDEYATQEQSVADFAKTMSHPARVAILKVLAQKNTCICGEIVEVLPLAQATVSQHLKELKNSGLITGELEGTTSCYCINWKNLQKELDKFNKFADGLIAKGQKNGCC
ncbi:MAG: metalloregulator ArsR/SmtB family transcription factor [Flavobacteriales bacterium]|nr:metalloregulator ArsR/SmtB family transcription factor [Flavobacteriales bacterium]